MIQSQALTVITFLAITFISCSSKNTREEKYDSGNPKQKYEVVEKEDGSFFKDGYYKEWFENGQIKVSGSYSDNRETGNWQWFYKTGKLSIDGNYKNGLKDGVWKEYSENGQILSDLNYLANELDGHQQYWYSSGQKKSDQNFKAGKRNGELKLWDENGKIKGQFIFNYDVNQTVIGKWNQDSSWKKNDTAGFSISGHFYSFFEDESWSHEYVPNNYNSKEGKYYIDYEDGIFSWIDNRYDFKDKIIYIDNKKMYLDRTYNDGSKFVESYKKVE